MWWLLLFWVLLIPLLVVMGVVYGTSRKLYKLFYVLTLFTYVIFIAYVIDVFHLGKQWVLLLLVGSAALMLFIGYYMTRQKPRRKRRGEKAWGQKARVLLVALLLLLFLLIVLGSFATVERTPSLVRALPRSSVMAVMVGGPRVELGKITYTNNFFLPAVIPDTSVVACWYNSSTQQRGPQLAVSDGSFERVDREPLEVAPGKRVERRFAIGFGGDPVPRKFNQTRYEGYDTFQGFDMILFATGKNRLSCSDLSSALFNVTIRVIS